MSSSNDIANVLQGVLSAENDVRCRAEAALAALKGEPSLVPSLLQQLTRNPASDIRQVAAIVLRKRLAALWNGLARALQTEFKAALMQAVLQGAPISAAWETTICHSANRESLCCHA
jgi:hypothetical protein